MPFFRTPARLVLAALAAVSCASSNAYVWRASNYSFLPEVVPRAPVMILPTTILAADSGAVGAGDVGPAGRARADSVIAATLAQRLPNALWLDASAVRSRAEADRSLPHPDSMPMHLLPLWVLVTVPDTLMSQIRRLAKLHPARYHLVPARLTYRATRTGRARAEFTVLLIDVKVGVVLWRSDVAGESDTELNAVAAAFRRLTATHTPIPR